MNTKLVRISPANSSSNIVERWNLIAIQTLRIFEQNYAITDQNFDMLLSMCGQMVNQGIQENGHSPFYLHYGTLPRKNNFLSLHSLTAVKTVDQHVKDLIKCQNVCFVLAQQMAERISKQNKDILLPNK